MKSKLLDLQISFFFSLSFVLLGFLYHFHQLCCSHGTARLNRSLLPWMFWVRDYIPTTKRLHILCGTSQGGVSLHQCLWNLTTIVLKSLRKTQILLNRVCCWCVCIGCLPSHFHRHCGLWTWCFCCRNADWILEHHLEKEHTNSKLSLTTQFLN